MVNIQKLWKNSASLTAVSLYMLAAFFVFGAGVFLDHRVVTGVPVWLKPAKFAISSAIYTATMAWLLGYITVWPSLMKATRRILAAAFLFEVSIIDLQAARGTISHYNAATPFDVFMFGAMGNLVMVIWLASVVIFAALMKQKFQDAEWGQWLRMGLLVSLIGSLMGGLMLRRTPEQTEILRTTHHLTVSGGHTVGAPDGGPGFAGTGWSTEHGDLRIPHFLGLHGVQLIPLIGWLLGPVARRRKSLRTGASYLGLLGILFWQAERGQSFFAPDQLTLLVLAAWLVVSMVALLAPGEIRERVHA